MARSQVVQMCEEVASRVERAARRLRPPAWFRAAAASPRGFLLAARRPSRLPPWPLPALEGGQPPPPPPAAAASGSHSAPATLTRRRDRDRQRAADAADEETWSRDAATLYATPLSSRRQRPQSDWQTAPLGGWDSTPPRRHRSQLTLRTTSPAPASDAGWSQEVRRPYLGWRSLERLSRRPWTPEERLAASLLERSGRSTPISSKEASAPNKQSRTQPSDADAPRVRTAASSLRSEPAGTSTPPASSGRTEHTTHSHRQSKELSPLSRRVTTLTVTVNERNTDAETPSSSGSKSAEFSDMSTGSLELRPAEEDSSRKRHIGYENSHHLEQDTLPSVSNYPEVKSQKSPQHKGLPLSTQIKTLPVRATEPAEDLAFASHNYPTKVRDKPYDVQHFPSAEGDTVSRGETPEKVADRDMREEKGTTLKHQYQNGPTQLPAQLKALSVTTHYNDDGDDLSAKTNDKHFPARDLLASSYNTVPLNASNVPTSVNTTSTPIPASGEDYYRTTNHVNLTKSPLLRERTFTIDRSIVSDNGDFRTKQLPTVELRTRSLEVTLPQRVTTNDTSRKVSIQEQFWVAEDHTPSAVQEDPSLLILPLVKQTATAPAAHSSSISSSIANRKSTPTFPTSSPIKASLGAAIDTKTLPYPVQLDYVSNTNSPSSSAAKMFDVNQLRSVELRTRSVEIPLPQVTSVIADPSDSNFSPSAAAKNTSVPNILEGSSQSSAVIRAVSMPPVPRDRTFCIESPSVPLKGTSTFRQLPAAEFQSPSSDVTLVQRGSAVATARPYSHRQETEPIPSGLDHRHSVPASPLVETSLTTIHVTPSPVVAEYRSVYSDTSPLLGRKPFTVNHVEAPGGYRTKNSDEDTKSREVSLSSALPKPFEPMPISQSKIPVPTGSKPSSEKETTVTAQMDTSHRPLNHIQPTERIQKSSFPATSVIRRPSYRVATRNELNPSYRKKRSAADVNTAGDVISTPIISPAENSRSKTAPIVKPPRLRTKDNSTTTPKPLPRQKHTLAAQTVQRSDNVGPVTHNTELHLPNGVSPLPYSALRILDSQRPPNTTGPTNTMSVSFKLPVSSESDTPASKQPMPSHQNIPNPTLLTPLKYKPCTTTDL
ncbi:mucin-4-like [Schistocerca gregaria]|uniref:mucin-4-like n=1 Tax=Schistocerca gregaria TaxID=7010 RepID=UPI00211F19B6|nr:mucin-4-like [Schistocerca gregaria]